VRYAYDKRGAEIIGVVDISKEKRKLASRKFHVP